MVKILGKSVIVQIMTNLSIKLEGSFAST